jgi:hypothetical protein
VQRRPTDRVINRRNTGEKKARLGSRADKGLEIFFVNEKVRFGKQKFQYTGSAPFRLFTQVTIIYFNNNNNLILRFITLFFCID